MQGVLGSRQHAGPSRAPRSHRTAAAPCRRALAARPYGPHRPLGPCSVAAGGGGEDGDGPALDERQMFVKLSIAASTGRLDLSDCRLRDLPPGLWEISDLQELSLAGNHITELPAGVGALRELRRLVVAGNSLRQLPAEIWGLAGLEGLWAHGNHLAEVPADVGALTGLKALSLAGARACAAAGGGEGTGCAGCQVPRAPSVAGQHAAQAHALLEAWAIIPALSKAVHPATRLSIPRVRAMPAAPARQPRDVAARVAGRPHRLGGPLAVRCAALGVRKQCCQRS